MKDKTLQRFVEEIKSAKSDAGIAGIVMRIHKLGIEDLEKEMVHLIKKRQKLLKEGMAHWWPK